MTAFMNARHWYGLVGAPTDIGNFGCGAASGPAALRAGGFLDRMRHQGIVVRDQGDVDGPAEGAGVGEHGIRHVEATAAWCRAVRDACASVLADGGTPLMAGGDHSLALGSVAAAAAHARKLGKPLHVFWFDAHPDFNTPDTSPSGNTHGMPMAAACGMGHREMLDVGAFTPLLHPHDLTQFGIRDVDHGERAHLLRHGVRFHEMPEVRRAGLLPLVAEALERAERAGAHLHVSFDMDALDPEHAPGVGTPVPGGLTLDEAVDALRLVGESGLVGSFDLVELAAVRECDGCRTVHSALELLQAFLRADRQLVVEPLAVRVA